MIIIISLCLFREYAYETFEWVTNLWSKKIPETVDAGAPYNNMCLTKNHSGWNSPAYDWWRDRDSTIKAEYAHCRPRWPGSTQYVCDVRNQPKTSADLPPVKPHTEGRRLSSTLAHSIATEYYHNPVKYCEANPGRYPCPNSWVDDAGNARRSAGRPTENMRIPALKDELEPQVRTTEEGLHTLAASAVNDNSRMLIVYPGREDRALC